jgi:outer membrane protein
VKAAPIIAALGLLLSLTGPARAEGFAVIDLQGAVTQTEDGIKAQAQLKKLLDRGQQDLDNKQIGMSKMRADIERQARFLSREALNRRMEMWQKEMVQLQSVYLNYNKELDKKQSELMAPIIQRMIALITKVAREKGYDVVIEKRAAPYSRGDLDITDRVVQMYNSGETG